MPATANASGSRLLEMRALYERGATLREVGEEFGISGERVGQLFRGAGLRTRSTGETRALEREPRAREMYELYGQGMTLGEVGEKFGISASGVRHLFEIEGLPLDSRARADASKREQKRVRESRAAQMYELYERGATVAEVGEKFGVSPSRVGQLFQETGRETRPQGLVYPVEEMHELYEQGATLAEVGEDFGMSAKRVFAIFKAAGLGTRSVAETAELKRRADRERWEEIVQVFRRLNRPNLVAEELEIPLSTVTEVLRERIGRGEYRARTHEDKARKRFSDEELREFLREASSTQERVLSAKDYANFASDRETSDGRRWPSAETHMRRFGSWRKALHGAGLATNDSLKIGKEKAFATEDCVKAILSAHRELGRVPTKVEYIRYARKSKGALPGITVIIRRCGSWTGALSKTGL
jgi:transposase